jgi:hypothetical protein
MVDQSEPVDSSGLNISDPHRFLPVFVNQVAGSGHLNGVVNLTFATAQFTPTQSGKVDPDLTISCRRRMDLYCAQERHSARSSNRTSSRRREPPIELDRSQCLGELIEAK